MKVFLFILASIASFFVLAQDDQDIVGSWNLAGFVCERSGDFKLVSIPEQMSIDGEWTVESNGSMSMTASFPGGGRCEITGNYEYRDSELSLEVEDTGGQCPGGERGMRQEFEDIIIEDDFLYIPAPEGLAGGEEACKGRLYQAFARI